jgi:hypothetical protein
MRSMDRRERERILWEGGVGAEAPHERARERSLAEDLETSPLRGRRLRQRLRNFRPPVDTYVASLGGPLPYMQRLREIELQIAAHERRLREAHAELATRANGEEGRFAAAWLAAARAWRFDEVNELIERHNRFYPVESRLPMDPRTGDFVLVSGRHYALARLDAAWILERFPTQLAAAAA